MFLGDDAEDLAWHAVEWVANAVKGREPGITSTIGRTLASRHCHGKTTLVVSTILPREGCVSHALGGEHTYRDRLRLHVILFKVWSCHGLSV